MIRTLKTIKVIVEFVIVFIAFSVSLANANTWDIQTVDQFGDKGAHNSIAIDSAGRPHISYREYDWWYVTDYLKYAFWDGTKWQTQYVDEPGDIFFLPHWHWINWTGLISVIMIKITD